MGDEIQVLNTVFYPKKYIRGFERVMSGLGIGLSEQDLRIISFGAAIGFLQSTPFPSAKPIILNR